MNSSHLPLSDYPDHIGSDHFHRVAGAIATTLACTGRKRLVDSFAVRYETGSSVANVKGWLQKTADGVPAATTIAAATWDNTAKTLTKTAQATNFVWREGQIIYVSGGSGWAIGFYRVASRVSADAWGLTNLDGTAINIAGSSDVAGTVFGGVPLSPNGAVSDFDGSVPAAIVLDDGSGSGFPRTKQTAKCLRSDAATQGGTGVSAGARNQLATTDALQFVTSVTPTALADVAIHVNWRTKID